MDAPMSWERMEEVRPGTGRETGLGHARNDLSPEWRSSAPEWRAGELGRGEVGLEWYQYGMKYGGGTKGVFVRIERNMDLNTFSI